MKQFNPSAIWRRLWKTLEQCLVISISDVGGSGSSLSCSEEQEGNGIKTAGLMF